MVDRKRGEGHRKEPGHNPKDLPPVAYSLQLDPTYNKVLSPHIAPPFRAICFNTQAYGDICYSNLDVPSSVGMMPISVKPSFICHSGSLWAVPLDLRNWQWISVSLFICIWWLVTLLPFLYMCIRFSQWSYTLSKKLGEVSWLLQEADMGAL